MFLVQCLLLPGLSALPCDNDLHFSLSFHLGNTSPTYMAWDQACASAQPPEKVLHSALGAQSQLHKR